MIASFLILTILLVYLLRCKQVLLFMIVLSILPQYHFRYWLYMATDFSNHRIVYGNMYDGNIDAVASYLDVLFVWFTVILFLYTRLTKHGRSVYTTNRVAIRNEHVFEFLLVGLLGFAVFFRFFGVGAQSEENFPTFLLALICGFFAYAGPYTRKTGRFLFVTLLGGAAATLIGFKSLILIFFISIGLSAARLNSRRILSVGLLGVLLMIFASVLRGVEGNLLKLVFLLATSHYDSWSFLVVAFSNDTVSISENYSNWLLSFITLIPGFGGFDGISTYGRYLNLAYVGEWLEHASVLLSPGIVGEFWSLGRWSAFLGLPVAVIGLDVIFKSLFTCRAPYAVVLMGYALFLLEAPLSNLGQLVKVILVIYVLDQTVFGRWRFVVFRRSPGSSAGQGGPVSIGCVPPTSG